MLNVVMVNITMLANSEGSSISHSVTCECDDNVPPPLPAKKAKRITKWSTQRELKMIDVGPLTAGDDLSAIGIDRDPRKVNQHLKVGFTVSNA